MTGETIVIHGRFAPDGSVVEMGERPAALTPQEWFNFLSVEAADSYRPLAGSRITFRLTREKLEALKAQRRSPS